MNDKLLGMMGLARRAGKVVVGSQRGADTVRKGTAKLVTVASDASDNTKKMMFNVCKYCDVDCIVYSTVSELGYRLGTGITSVAVVTDDNFAKAIMAIYDEGKVM